MDKNRPIPAIFTPDNEPYLGRESVYRFDQTIVSCMKSNKKAAFYTQKHRDSLSDLQRAACEIIPAGIHIALSIRELVRQGYLYGAVVLMRPFIERAAIISYLHENPEKVQAWKDGWKYKERPSLRDMLHTMSGQADLKIAKNICEHFNHIVHGDPVGASFNIINMGERGFGHAPSKMLDQVELCDDICFQSYCYLIVLMGRMKAIFPDLDKE